MQCMLYGVLCYYKRFPVPQYKFPDPQNIMEKTMQFINSERVSHDRECVAMHVPLATIFQKLDLCKEQVNKMAVKHSSGCTLWSLTYVSPLP